MIDIFVEKSRCFVEIENPVLNSLVNLIQQKTKLF